MSVVGLRFAMNRLVREYPHLDIPRPGESLPDRFARVVQSHHSRAAVASETWNATYGELDAVADRLAHALVARGGQPGDRIALLMRHDTPQIAAMLAVLKAGRIVVVLNPTDAASRLRLVVEDAEPACVLADQENAALASEVARDFCATASHDDLARERASQPKLTIDPEATACLVYTSGSSGRPKGVMMNHHHVMHSALRGSAAMDIRADSRIALLASLSGLHGFNAGWYALLHGALLSPFPVMERGVTGLADWMTGHRITAFSAPTSLFRSFMKSLKEGRRINSVRMVRVAGELATSDDFKEFQEHFSDECFLLNTLASSEAGNIASQRYSKRDKVPEGSLAVGRVFEGIEIAIVDEQGRLLKPGEAGQIAITSPYLSQGYWRNERLTAERYSRDSRGVPVVRSGDWGRINANGLLEFVGRKDTRVKIHGASVELDEVERALCKAPGVEKAVVCAWEGSNSTQLVAYVTLRRGHISPSLALRHEVRALLPDLMVPSIFIVVDNFPLTPQGKIDRQKLLETHPPKAKQSSASGFETELEASLGAIWSEAFDLPDIGREDNFFELGGDSLIASVIAARLFDETGAEFGLDMFAKNPTIARMAIAAGHMRLAKRNDLQLRRVSREQPLPLSFSQERIWNYSQTDQGVAAYTMVSRHRILGALDLDVFRECLNRLSERYELLRATFTVSDGRPYQKINPPGKVELSFVNLTDATDPAAEVRKLAERQRAQHFDLSKGPLQRFTLIKIKENEHWLLRLFHHILSDAQSRELYFEALAELYEALVRDAGPAVSNFEPLQYADYAYWQRQSFRAETQSYQNLLSWWKKALSDPLPAFDLSIRRTALAEDADWSEGIIDSKISVEASQRLIQIASQQNATHFQLGLAILLASLAARTGQRDLVVGTYVSNRKRLELQRMFGDFSNLVALRFFCDLEMTFREWAVAVRDKVNETVAYSELPYEELRRSFQCDGMSAPEIRAIVQVKSVSSPLRFAETRDDSRKASHPQMALGLPVSIGSAELRLPVQIRCPHLRSERGPRHDRRMEPLFRSRFTQSRLDREGIVRNERYRARRSALLDKLFARLFRR